MYPIHEDVVLTSEQRQRVLDYVRATGFALPGAEPSDFTDVVPRARYAGWDFMSEDLNSYAVGLICSKPGYERKHTFIRMSYAQLMGEPGAEPLELNKPVLATDALRMQRWRDTPAGPSRTGVDSYAVSPAATADPASGREPAVQLDLRMINDTLSDVLLFHAEGKTSADVGYFDLQVDWGVLMAGRYPRLRYLREQNRLSDAEAQALARLEARIDDAESLLSELNLPTRKTALTPEVRRHRAHHH